MATLHTKVCAFASSRIFACAPLVAAAALFLSPLDALAQSDDAVGIRAQGMAGAFTAVADDASATWWNPAGLGSWNSSGGAGGTFINLILDLQGLKASSTERAADGTQVPAWRVGSGGVSVGSPALGLSYYRLRISEMQPISSIGGLGGVRQDQGIAEVYLRSLVVQQFGVTVGQSLGEHLVVGSTLKLVRGDLGAGTRPVSGASLEQASDLETRGETHAGVDVGAMAVAGELRAGLTIRNLTEPEFGSGADALVLKRHVRGGLAWLSGEHGPFGTMTLSADADLTAQATALGDERRAAAGVEVSTRNRRLAARGGVGASTVGDSRLSLSAGLSAAIRPGSYIDVAATGGSDPARRGWGLALRVTF